MIRDEIDEIDKLFCAICGKDVKRRRWSMHWKRAHGITHYPGRKELKDGEVPTNPYWLAPDDGTLMITFDESLAQLPTILTLIALGDKIPWHYSDYTFKLYKKGYLEREALDWGADLRRMIRKRERDSKQ